MTEFSICEHYTVIWICQNMPWQSFEYILGSKYAMVLNMQELHRVLNMLQYGWICLNKVWIWLHLFYENRVLNMYHAVYSVRSPCRLMNIYWVLAYSELGQRFKMEHFQKIVIILNYFFAKNSILNLWEGSEYYVSVFNYVRVLNIWKIL